MSTPLVTWTLDQAIEKAKAVVKERGEAFIYRAAEAPCHKPQSCYYFEPVSLAPSCLIGQMLANDGVTPEMLLDAAGEDSMSNLEGVIDLIDEGVIKAEGEALSFLDVLQCKQDSRNPYGKALQAALKAVGR